jgi:hypothetical protein
LNVDLLFKDDATRGRPWSCSFMKPSAPTVTAQRVDALVGPVPESRSRILKMVPVATPAPLSSRMSTSLPEMPPVTLT